MLKAIHPIVRVTSVVLLAACSRAGTPPSVAPAGPAAAPVEQYTARALYENTTITGASFSHDESRVLISSNQTGIFNVYAQSVAGGAPVALTSSTANSTFGQSYFPRDDRFLFAADQGGNELTHLYVQELDGTVRDLTPGDTLKAGFGGWSGDKTHFFVMTNERDPQALDLYRYATDGYARELWFQNPGGFMIGSISPDGQWIALIKQTSNTDSDIYLWHAAARDAEPRLITPTEGEVAHGAEAFAPDGKTLYYTTNGQGEFAELWSYDIATGKHTAEVRASWDVAYMELSERGTYRVVAINQNARTVLRVTNMITGQDVALPALPDGEIKAIELSPSETKMAFYASSDRSPANLYVLDLATGAHQQLTSTNNPAVNPDDLVSGEVIRYPSFDGLEIPAILYKPKQAAASSKVPAVVLVHGGPGGQSRIGYSPDIQYLANHGYAVLAVNNRGSSGYGKTFYHLDDRKHGEVDLEDCVWARRYLEGLAWVDGSRVAIMGGSYGGYMVLAALAFRPDAFEVGIDIFGVSNWVRTLQSIPAWWGAHRQALYAELGDPATDAERLRRISPLFHATNITKPLLVVQGANDPRVLKVESDEIVAAVQATGVPVEYLVFDDEGHGFTKTENRIKAAETYLGFLNRYLKK